MSLSIQTASEDQYTALHGIMALCGEHMHRVMNLSHWYPFPASEWYAKHAQERDVFAVYKGGVLAGTFMLSEKPERYYEDMSAYWREPDAPALYFSAFGILPAYQQQGMGSWVMGEVDKMVQTQKRRYLRFDGFAGHPKLLQFYTRLGYEQRGILPVGELAVMCFEKDFAPTST